jgi:hypothetical protein
MAVTVLFAVYGGLRDGNPLQEEAADVTQALQALLGPGSPGTVVINDKNMGVDPAPGVMEHFGALIQVDEETTPRAYACQENQEIAILA